MHNVVVSIESRQVAITDDGFFSSCNETESDYGYLLIEDEKSQLELALKIDSSESVPENGISDGFIAQRHSVYLVDGENRKPSTRHKKICFLLEVHFVWRRRGRDTRKPSLSSKSSHRRKESHCQGNPSSKRTSYYKSSTGTFPVKVAIPVVPTIRVLVTFTKFEELQPLDEFSTPPLSTRSAGNESQPMMHGPARFIVAALDKSPYELLNLLNNIDMHMVGLLLLFNQAFRLIVNHPDSILNSLTREIKEVGQNLERRFLSWFADIVSLCIQTEPEFGPTMSKIVESLELLNDRSLADDPDVETDSKPFDRDREAIADLFRDRNPNARYTYFSSKLAPKSALAGFSR
ncbi:hypothetical protein IFM89_005117 [Coptis chinensis]|uniref:Ankyrin repeat domain-containing protein n=1 Tax=Coptis chinensis TaxID=261450 RepID=A0A835M4A2_9MAGN|nr:hypothetical protein IFM89_005117 [Coptis chinensis]